MSLSKKIGIVMFSVFIIVTAYFVVSEYKSTKHILERENLNKLHIISSSLALQIDGAEHQSVTNKYTKEDGLLSNSQDTSYYQIHKLLQKYQLNNGVETDIYTLFYQDAEQKGKLEFGVTSGESPYYRHEYKNYPITLKQNYEKGGLIEPYGDDHGHWISAFSPIFLEDGTVVGVVQVDKQLDVLYDEIMNASYKKFIIASILLGLISVLFFYFIKVMEKDDRKKRKIVEDALDVAETQKKKIQDSINYAQKIQQAIIPSFLCIKEEGIDVDLFYQPKDVVSGDFPWFFCKNDKIFIASVDCTGHGVPGAMMSFVGYFLLNYVSNNTETTPALILNDLDKEVKTVLKQDDESGLSNDGMDLGLMMIDKNTKQVLYAGAKRPLYYVANGEVAVTKGTAKSIGGKTIKRLKDRKFEDVEFSYGQKNRFYIFSDGITDQFNEEGTHKFGVKQLKKTLENSMNDSVSDSITAVGKELQSWQGEGGQTDDMLLIGIDF